MSTGTAAAGGQELTTVFDPGTCADIRRRYGSLAAHVRPGVFSAALDPSKSTFRDWLDREVGELDEVGRAHVLGRLRSEGGHSAALAELVGRAVLRDGAGFAVTLDPELDGLTPDQLASNPSSGEPVLIAEVWSRSVPTDVVKAPAQLGRAGSSDRKDPRASAPIRQRQRNWVVRSAGEGRVRTDRQSPSKAPTARREPGGLAGHVCQGLNFEIAGTNARTARLLPVTASRSIDRDHVIDAIEAKLGRYRQVADFPAPESV